MLKLNVVNEKAVKALISDNKDVAKIKGAVHYLNEATDKATDKEVVAYLLKHGYTAPKRATNFRGALYDLLAKREVKEKEFNDLIADASDNTLNNRKHFNAIRELCNEVRANANAKPTTKGVK